MSVPCRRGRFLNSEQFVEAIAPKGDLSKIGRSQFATLFRVSAILGYHNVYVSIYENGSSDQTKALLRIFDALCRSVGLRVTIRTSMRTRGAFNHRIEYLAEVRNAAFVPLHELRDAQNEYFDTIIFMNDILPCCTLTDQRCTIHFSIGGLKDRQFC